jgi:hypothetical protein
MAADALAGRLSLKWISMVFPPVVSCPASPGVLADRSGR